MKKLVAIMFLCVIFVICEIGFTACSISNNGNTDDKGTKTEQDTNSGDSTGENGTDNNSDGNNSEDDKDTKTEQDTNSGDNTGENGTGNNSAGNTSENDTDNYPQPTADEYFTFTLLGNDTYEIKAKDVNNMPENVVLPKTYNGKAVTSIGGHALEGCRSLTSITIPNSVTSIGGSAFRNCSSLTSITIPSSVTSIGDSAFSSCSSLTSITIPDSVTNIGGWAFSYCSSLTSISVSENNSYYSSQDGILYNKEKTGIVNAPKGISGAINLPNTLTSIGDSAFSGCSNLMSITIPDSVTSIGNSAFGGCSSLTSITVDEDNEYYKSIDGNLYTKDGTILIQYAIGKTETEFTIPDSVTSIGEWAFFGCSSLTSITIPDSVTSIGFMAFYNCSSLTSITIPDSVTSIEGGAFRYCSSLTSIYYTGTESKWASIGGLGDIMSSGITLYINNEPVTNVVLDNITEIKPYAFYNCSSLTSITISDSVTSIGDGAFSGCSSLTSIKVSNNNTAYKSIDENLYSKDGKTLIQYASGKTATTFSIPNSVTSIGRDAFSGCRSLTSVKV